MNELVSVVVSIYNKEKYIQRCIDSLLAQTYENLDIVLVDDGSTDGTSAILDTCADPRIHIVHQKNQGASEARNTGIDASKGSYIVFADADDRIPERGIELLMNGIKRNNADICSGRFNSVYDNEKVKPCETVEEICVSGTGMLELCLKDFFMTHHVWATMFRREFIGNKRFLKDALVHEDNHFMFECAMRTPVYQTICDIVYEYSVTETSYSRNSFDENRSKVILELAVAESERVKREHPELSEYAENQMIKGAMAVLANVPGRQYEKKCISEIKRRRKYFIPDSGFDKALFFLATNHLYGVYKLIYKIRFRKK